VDRIATSARLGETWAMTARGHANAALPTSEMNSRRLPPIYADARVSEG